MVSKFLGDLKPRRMVDIATDRPFPVSLHRCRMSRDFPVPLAGIGGSKVVQAAAGVLLDSFPNSTQTAFPPFPPVFIAGHDAAVSPLNHDRPLQDVHLSRCHRQFTDLSTLRPDCDLHMPGLPRLP